MTMFQKFIQWLWRDQSCAEPGCDGERNPTTECCRECGSWFGY